MKNIMLCQSPLRTQSQIKHVGVCCKAAEWHSGNQLVIEQGSMRNQEKKCLQQQLHNRFVFSSLLQVPFSFTDGPNELSLHNYTNNLINLHNQEKVPIPQAFAWSYPAPTRVFRTSVLMVKTELLYTYLCVCSHARYLTLTNTHFL